jgi:hypothetical protein
MRTFVGSFETYFYPIGVRVIFIINYSYSLMISKG